MKFDNDILKTSDAARYLGVTPKTLRGYRNRGMIEAQMLNRKNQGYKREDLDSLVQKWQEDR